MAKFFTELYPQNPRVRGRGKRKGKIKRGEAMGEREEKGKGSGIKETKEQRTREG
jgi:hypothetical protein